MKHDDIKIGEYYKWTDIDGSVYLMYVVGREPFKGYLVGACDAWPQGVDILTEYDFDQMEII